MTPVGDPAGEAIKEHRDGTDQRIVASEWAF